MRMTCSLLLLALAAVALPPVAAEEKTAPKEKVVKAGEAQGKLARLPDKGKLGLSVYNGKSWQPVELPVADDLKVRTLVLPPAFDDKGNPKKYTAKELAELKGPDKNLPGYAASEGDLKRDQVVKVQLVKKPGRPKTKEEAQDYKPKVGLILIVREP